MILYTLKLVLNYIVYFNCQQSHLYFTAAINRFSNVWTIESYLFPLLNPGCLNTYNIELLQQQKIKKNWCQI